MSARRLDSPLFVAAWADPSCDPSAQLVICGGGGGDSATGVRNILAVVPYHADSKELREPRHVLCTDGDAPMALAMHPSRREFFVSFPANNSHNGRLKLVRLVTGDEIRLEYVDGELPRLEAIEEQRSISFNTDGKLFATGGNNGHLRVFKWPSLEVVIDRSVAHTSIRDMDFSLDSAFLACTDDVGPSRVWDLSAATAVATLPLNKAGFCRFSRDGANPCLYVTSSEDSKGHITTWNMQWKKIGSKKVQEDPICAFSISSDGKLLAIGDPEGNVRIVSASKLNVLRQIKKAHSFFVPSMEFSPDNRALLSVSGDSSARVTALEVQARGWRSFLILWIFLLAALFSLVLRGGYGGFSEFVQSNANSDTSHDMI